LAQLNIITIGDPILRQKAIQVKRFDDRLANLLDNMTETMYKNDGVGLAAPQIGISKRIVVIDTGDRLLELVNPEVIEKKGSQIGPEGCLSIPGEYGDVERAQWAKIQAQDRKGNTFTLEGEGLLARAFQHEIDHLNGILFIDKLVHKSK